MSYQITSDNIDISPSMTALATKKLSKLENKMKNTNEDLKSMRVVLNSAPQDKFEAKIEVTLGSHKYFGHEIDYTLETAVIKTVEEIEKQLEKLKDTVEKTWEDRRELKRSSEKVINE